jgi:acyl-CoA synthetase (AMP-forming)/AMP-acid ligase II
MNTNDLLTIATSIVPDREFIVFENLRRTYQETGERINRLAHALSGLGLGRQDRFGILAVNCPEYIETYFATAKIGAVFVPLNFRAKADELTYMINTADIKVLAVGERYLGMLEEMRPALTTVKHVISLEGPHQDMPVYEDLIAAAPEDEFFGEVDDEDMTILMFTSGTTGRPKAVPMTHNTFGNYVLENVQPADPEIEEKNVLTVPLYHVAGVQAMMAAAYGGRTLVLMRQFDTKEWMELVAREKVQRVMLVPTMLKMVLDHPDFGRYDLSSLQVITYGAAAMPFEVIKKAIQAFPGVSFINAFGQTETGSTITTLGPEDHVIEGDEAEREKKLKRLASSIGRPLPDVEVRIVDEEGDPVEPGTTGEIVVRGPRVMRGYLGDEQKTAQAFTKDGWLRTSDMGYMDEDGYIYLAGRADDMIIRGGENISPREIEDVLLAHPKVEEVAVIGVPDEVWGQEPRAIVVLKEGAEATAEEIMAFTQDRLASFKRPRAVVFVSELPRSALGKLSRKQLVKEYSGQA